MGYILAFKLKCTSEVCELRNYTFAGSLRTNGKEGRPTRPEIKCDELVAFIENNFSVFEKLQGKKPVLIKQTIQMLMERTNASQLVIDELIDMFIDDADLDVICDDLTLKCLQIRSLLNVVEALAKKFGEVHVEQRFDDYVVLRVILNDSNREIVEVEDQNPLFSSVVDFVNTDEVIKGSTLGCDFLSARQLFSLRRHENNHSSVYQFSIENQRVERYIPE